MPTVEFGQLLRDARLNAALAWAITGVVALVAVDGFLTGDPLWGAFATAVLVLVVIPPLAFLSARTMLPWEVLLLAALPILGRAFATFAVSSQIASYLSVAALALLIAVELQTFTSVRMSAGFAVAFVVITTMATAGIWAVARWTADIWLGTGFIDALGPDETAQERAMMLEFVASFIAGVLAGLVFEFYVRRVARVKSRLPEGSVP
ncbi:hypothetical protein [Salinibaculum rarum]|uniref:hypothetical protein n=1 Tax=Salinibaculum rarum TaxID=3058903 RepID=UPI00265DEA22|nr:hypothetical protein [Salinibaculum sp. KK48]